MKKYCFTFLVMMVLAGTGCGSDPGNNQESPGLEGSARVAPEEADVVRPDTPNANSQLERLARDEAAYDVQSLGLAKSSKNWAALILGALLGLAEFGGVDIAPNWDVWTLQPEIEAPDLDWVNAPQSEAEVEPRGITGIWRGSLLTIHDECGPEEFGEEREFRLSVQRQDGQLVVLDQDGLVYIDDAGTESSFNAWWNDGAGSISSIELRLTPNYSASVVVRDELNRDGTSCVQEYTGFLD